ncbi:unnamed protein product [Caenorhabditis sp. 36 PRJEB53466]|nr:unnamed protein product [Caenorhabditis sp. 36 PRJEB53466]
MKFLLAFVLCSLSSGFPLVTEIPNPVFSDFDIPDTVDDLDPTTVVQLFIQFEEVYQKAYRSPLEQAKARAIFQDNLLKIIDLNRQYSNESLRFGINYYTDFSDLEFSEKVANLHVDTVPEVGNSLETSENLTEIQSPTNFDWRERKDTVSGVSNQGYCGCSWGFTVASVVESAFAIKNSKSVKASEQQLCDCAQGGNAGCSGGSVLDGLEYVKRNGMTTEANYQRNVQEQQEDFCADRNDRIAVSDYQFVRPATATQIQKTLLKTGPIGVGFKVSNSFRHYKSGVFTANDCDKSEHFIGWHSVTVVGYGTDKNGHDFWIAKNSWSPSFGENGFFRMARNRDLCDIESKMPVFVEI